MDANILEDLTNVPILSELSKEELELVAPYWQYLVVDAGEIIFSEGDPADAIYYVLEGELIIYKNKPFKKIEVLF